MFALIPAVSPVSRRALDNAPQFETISEAFAALTGNGFIVRVPKSKSTSAAVIVAFNPIDINYVSALDAKVLISGGTARACKHSNLVEPLFPREDGKPVACVTCGAGFDA